MSRSDFKIRVFAIVGGIPEGSVLTYKEVAKRAGNYKASRAVGAILRTNFNPEISCHRVIRSDGAFGGYNRGAYKKISKLRGEMDGGCLRATARTPCLP